MTDNPRVDDFSKAADATLDKHSQDLETMTTGGTIGGFLQKTEAVGEAAKLVEKELLEIANRIYKEEGANNADLKAGLQNAIGKKMNSFMVRNMPGGKTSDTV